jgi:putative hemolysin
MQYFAADASLLLESDMMLRIVLQLGLFVVSAFFSGSETALFSLSRTELRTIRRESRANGALVQALLDQPRRLIISVLCGNQLVNVAAAANMTGILVRLYGIERAAVISTFVMVPLLLLLSEATPKTVAVSNPVGVSTKIVARPMTVWVSFAAPLAWIIRHVADRITTAIVGDEKAPENILQIDEFRTLVEDGVVRGELTATERALIYNLLQAGSSEVVEIMTPRTRVAFVDGNSPLPEIIDAFMAHRHSRVPVFLEARDNVVGFLHAEDILELIIDGKDPSELTLEDLMHAPVMVPSTKKIDEMFDYLQSHDIHGAAVLNEFGGVDGFVTMTDVLTYIFGRASGELPGVGVVSDLEAEVYEVPGEMKLGDFQKLTNFGIDDPRMTTIAGIVLRLLDRLPKIGDTVTVDDVAITVVAMDANRIARVRAKRMSRHTNEPESADRDHGNP